LNYQHTQSLVCSKKLIFMLFMLLLVGCQGRLAEGHWQAGRIPKSNIEEYVQRIGQKVSIVSSDSPEYKFIVMSNDIPDCWVKDKDTIAITSSMLESLESEAELAAILSHEIYHANKDGYRGKIYATKDLTDADAYSWQATRLAGFDPKGNYKLVTRLLQFKQEGNINWKAGYIGTHAPSFTRVNWHKKHLSKRPQGLRLNAEEYAKEIAQAKY